jgi:hypothetical protein
MTTVTHLPFHPNPADEAVLGHEVDDLLLSLRGLVLVRDLLTERGASADEIEEHSREADRVRARLAAMLGGGAAPLQDAVA